ncbi:MAG: MaoC family dehydratase N-terminal domain-containing protein [Clostridia bacterium]|nr:MaoC family dehydratase N-terminal domain-containing protein [Clostridia bacterium]
MLDRFRAGTEFGPRTFKVEASAISKFVSAIGDTNPVYFSNGFAPPTFPAVFFDLPLTYQGQVLHGEQEFTYVRPIKVGDEITCTTVVKGLRKFTAPEPAQLVILETAGRDRSGKLVYTAKTTLILKVG